MLIVERATIVIGSLGTRIIISYLWHGPGGIQSHGCGSTLDPWICIPFFYLLALISKIILQ